MNKCINLAVRLSPELNNHLLRIARRNGSNRSEAAREIIAAHLHGETVIDALKEAAARGPVVLLVDEARVTIDAREL